jgi:hypothetical protein
MPRSGGRSSSRGRSFGGGGYGRSSPYGSGAYRYTPRSGTANQSRSSSSSAYTRPPVYNTSNTTAQSSPLGMGGGLGSTIAHGMAFGAGSSIAHHTLGSLWGNPHRGYDQQITQNDPYQGNQVGMTNTSDMQSQPQNIEDYKKTNPCYDTSRKFVECMSQVDDLAKCQSLFEELKSCEKRMNI